MNDSLLLKPVAKKENRLEKEYPFPIIRSDAVRENECDSEWKLIEGHLLGNCVIVDDQESMKLLYNKGFYGKGTLSKHGPEICNKKRIHENTENQPRKKQRLEKPLPADDSLDEETIYVGLDEDVDEVFDVDDFSATNDMEDCELYRSFEDVYSSENESLQLTFEEAYFLSYGLGCLVVKDKDKLLNLVTLWNIFCELSPEKNFPVMYSAYHHLRSKGWIVRSGLKYGVDYVLYKDGPPFYHSTYAVIVKTARESDLKELAGNQHFTWGSLSALLRVTTTVGKGLMMLYVIKPNQSSEGKIATPYYLSQCKIEEVLLKRWVPSSCREEKT